MECKRSKDFADTLESCLCQSYIRRVAFVLGDLSRGYLSGGHLSEGGGVCTFDCDMPMHAAFEQTL